MEILNDFKSKYAAKLIAMGLHSNVYSAMLESERVENKELKQIYFDIEDYYMVYDETWMHPYVIKKMCSTSRNSGKIDVSSDANVKRIDW
jgi:hypothetical protein